jgi:membrane-associated phospholipid phosphatase
MVPRHPLLEAVRSLAARPANLVTGIYLLLTGALVASARRAFPHWQWALALHIAGVVLTFLILSRPAGPRSGWARFLADWYPAFLFLPLYKEVEVLAAALGNWSLTRTVQAAELGLFGAHLSIRLSQQYPYLWLSEALHLCYLSYVVLIPAVGGYWYFTGRREAFQQMLFLVAIGYFVSYLFFICYPVDSPYYLFNSLSGPLAQGRIFRLVHFVSDRAGARGGAFPSSHVTISTLVLLTAWARQRSLGYILLPSVVGIYVATVYGRFHYGVDVIAGWLLALAVWAAFSRVSRAPASSAMAEA